MEMLFFKPSTSYATSLKSKSNSISDNEYQRRLIAWEKTVANFALEDIHPSKEMVRIGNLYISGKISLEEQSRMMRKAILDGKV